MPAAPPIPFQGQNINLQIPPKKIPSNPSKIPEKNQPQFLDTDANANANFVIPPKKKIP